jgi:hypothetical protein
MAKWVTYRIRKPDGEYFEETVNVESQVPVDVHLGNIQLTMSRQYRELGYKRPMGQWELVEETA